MLFDRELALGLALAGDRGVLRDYLEDCGVSLWFSAGQVTSYDLQEMYELGSRQAYRRLAGLTLRLDGHLRAGLTSAAEAAADNEVAAVLVGRGPAEVVCWFAGAGWRRVPAPRLSAYEPGAGRLNAVAELRHPADVPENTPDDLAAAALTILTGRLAPA